MTTRIRLYKLGREGTFVSYYDGQRLTLIDPIVTDDSLGDLNRELSASGNQIDTIHLTSWDKDHCDYNSLEEILRKLPVRQVELPGYPPHHDDALSCHRLVYQYAHAGRLTVIDWSPSTLGALPAASGLTTKVLLWPRRISEGSNDNSTVLLFKAGDVTLLSCGDIESADIMQRICSDPMVRSEVDVLILPHHGADNGATSPEMLQAINPAVVLIGVNRENQFDHPKPEVVNMLRAEGIKCCTSKTGGALIESSGMTATITNYHGLLPSSQETFVPKRYRQLYRSALASALANVSARPSPSLFGSLLTPR